MEDLKYNIFKYIKDNFNSGDENLHSCFEHITEESNKTLIDEFYSIIKDADTSIYEKKKLLLCGLIAIDEHNKNTFENITNIINDEKNKTELDPITKDWKKLEKTIDDPNEKYKYIFYIQSCIF